MSNIEFVDTHCHLQFDKLAQNIGQVIDDAKKAGVTKLVCVGTTITDSRQAVDLAAKFDNVWAAVGVHPHDGKDFDFKNYPVKLEALLKMPKVVAVGETGLDFYKNYSPKADQEKLFRLQIELGAPTGLPFIFHIRDAWSDFWRIFDSYSGLRGVVHSFSAGTAELDQALSRGLYIALNGIMTFTNDTDQLEAAKKVPKDRLLLETDAPFLTPSPHRGKTCEPKYVHDIAEFLCNMRSDEIEDLANNTTANARGLFGV